MLNKTKHLTPSASIYIARAAAFPIAARAKRPAWIGPSRRRRVRRSVDPLIHFRTVIAAMMAQFLCFCLLATSGAAAFLNNDGIPSSIPSLEPTTVPIQSAPPTLLENTETPQPTISPPTDPPSTMPVTNAPTGAPTLAPTLLPVLKPVSGRLDLELMFLSSTLIGSSETDFLTATRDFYARKLILNDPLVTNVDVQLLFQSLVPVRRSRGLQQEQLIGSLFVDLTISGRVQVNNPADFANQDLERLIQQIMRDDFLELVVDLRNGDPDFFGRLTNIETLAITAGTPLVPTAAPSPGGRNPLLENDGDNSESFWSLGVILGVACGGAAVLVAICLAIAYYQSHVARKRRKQQQHQKRKKSSMQSNNRQHQPEESFQNWDSFRADGQQAGSAEQRRQQQQLHQYNVGGTDEDEYSDMESHAVYSYMAGTPAAGDASVTDNTFLNGDNMSYAYSLDPGQMDTTTMGVDVSVSNGRDIEIERMRTVRPSQSRPPSTIGGPAHASLLTGLTTDDTEDEISMTSDLHFTQAELAMLQNGDAMSESDSTSIGGSVFASLNQQHMSAYEQPQYTTRTVRAPAGKLGIVIDTTIEGPVVHEVTASSALKGLLVPGDIIVGIDNVDTRAMGAEAITSVMIQTAGRSRTLTVRSKSSL